MIMMKMYYNKYYTIVKRNPEELKAANLRMNFFKMNILKKNMLQFNTEEEKDWAYIAL